MTKPGVRLRVGHQQSKFWPILARFVDYCSPFLGPGVIFMVVEPQGALMCRSSTLAVLADSGPFLGLLLTALGSQSDFRSCLTPRCVYVSVINTRSFGRFWPVSWTITHSFGVPKRFRWLSIRKVRLRVGHQQSQFWPILARSLDYYSLFWVPIVIFIVVEPQGAFTCRSSTLIVLADSGPYHGLLLTVLESRNDFCGC